MVKFFWFVPHPMLNNSNSDNSESKLHISENSCILMKLDEGIINTLCYKIKAESIYSNLEWFL